MKNEAVGSRLLFFLLFNRITQVVLIFFFFFLLHQGKKFLSNKIKRQVVES